MCVYLKVIYQLWLWTAARLMRCWLAQFSKIRHGLSLWMEYPWNASTHSSCWAFMSRMIWSGCGMSMPFCPRPHLDCASWSSWNEQASDETTCCASTLAWYCQCWNMHVRRGTRASQLHRPRHWSHYSRGRWGSSFKIMITCCQWSELGLTRSSLSARIWLSAERFFKWNVLRESSCLHYLLPDKRESSITDKLRHAKTFEPLPIITVKFAILSYPTVYIIMIRPAAHMSFLLHVWIVVWCAVLDSRLTLVTACVYHLY